MPTQAFDALPFNKSKKHCGGTPTERNFLWPYVLKSVYLNSDHFPKIDLFPMNVWLFQNCIHSRHFIFLCLLRCCCCCCRSRFLISPHRMLAHSLIGFPPFPFSSLNKNALFSVSYALFTHTLPPTDSTCRSLEVPTKTHQTAPTHLKVVHL